MRNAFAESVFKLAKKEKDLILLAGDIGNRLFDNFKLKFKNRFYNCGVAEANMTGIASGLASAGLKPITYTITPFNTLKCLEQIKLDICYPNLPVIIVGTGSGLSYSKLGSSHHSMEDISVLKSLPNIQIICPGDKIEVPLALEHAYKSNKPTYIRLGKKGEPVVHNKIPKFRIGKGIKISNGSDVSLISIGNMLPICLNAKKILENKKLSVEL
ncbi:MAG: transketolase, partial [SAR202 cluster bacterium]|nr:transketolase [SAR202 cluster bacterium]